MIRLTTPAIVNWSVLRLPDGLNFSRLVRRPACTSSTSESPTILPELNRRRRSRRAKRPLDRMRLFRMHDGVVHKDASSFERTALLNHQFHTMPRITECRDS